MNVLLEYFCLTTDKILKPDDHSTVSGKLIFFILNPFLTALDLAESGTILTATLRLTVVSSEFGDAVEVLSM